MTDLLLALLAVAVACLTVTVASVAAIVEAGQRRRHRELTDQLDALGTMLGDLLDPDQR